MEAGIWILIALAIFSMTPLFVMAYHVLADITEYLWDARHKCFGALRRRRQLEPEDDSRRSGSASTIREPAPAAQGGREFEWLSGAGGSVVLSLSDWEGHARGQMDPPLRSCKPDGLSIDMDVCVICAEDLVPGARVRTLSCSHTYHDACIRQWLTHRRICPLCNQRVPLSEDNYTAWSYESTPSRAVQV